MSGLPLLWKGEVCSSEELNGESRAEVYWVLLQLALARGESCVLAFAGDSLRFRFDNGIWFSSLARRTISPAVECLLPPNNGDIGIKSVTPAYLEVDVLMLDMPPTIPPSSMQDLAHRILTENNLYDRRVSLRDKGLQARTEYVHTKFFDNPEKRSFFRRLLSCFIEGGLEWMKSASAILWKVLAPEPVGDHMSEGLFWAGVEINRSAESGIYKATQSLLQSPGTQEHGCEGNEYFEPVLKLLTLITDVRFLEFLQLQALVRVSSKDDYGIVRMPKNRTAVGCTDCACFRSLYCSPTLLDS
jgi:hypothetical protein